MQLSGVEARRRLTAARVVRLATADAEGVPHLVPATFVVHDDTILIAVDSKPKRHRNLRRLRNVAENPYVCVLADQYDDDWTQLWWARGDGIAQILADAPPADALPAKVPPADAPLDRLVAKYPQYREHRPDGPVLAIHVTRWSGWSYAS